MYKIISVDYEFDNENVKNLKFYSPESFLDADVLIINPHVSEWLLKKMTAYNGVNKLEYRNNPAAVIEIYKRRRDEIESLLKNGKIVLIFMAPEYRFEPQYASNQYLKYTNYEFLPREIYKITEDFERGIGETINCINQKNILIPLYKNFKDEILYNAYLKESIASRTLNLNNNDLHLTNKTNDVVGFSRKHDKGLVAFIPYFKHDVEPKKLFGTIMQCCKIILGNNTKTPIPEWNNLYKIPGEEDLTSKKSLLAEEIERLNQKMNEIVKQENELIEYKELLFEQGKPLENIVMKAFSLLDFHIGKYEDSDMEHDIILESDEGRIIGEIEGKDNDAISIYKLDQLSRVVDEDFHIRGVYPEGILIGNAYRLKKPEERPECFTEKVIISAKRKNFGLLNTVELFNACVRVLENPTDDNLKKEMRIHVFKSLGEEIKFDVLCSK
jgi:hypothetical protein